MRRLGGTLMVALLVSACSSGDDGAGAGDGGGGVEGQLRLLPSTVSADSGDSGAVVAYGDLAEAAALADVDLSEVASQADSPAGAAMETRLNHLNAITGGPIARGERSPVAAVVPEAAHPERMVDLDQFVEEVGWSVFDVRRFVEIQVLPDQVVVMEGDFDEDRLDDALGPRDDGVWVIGDPDGDLDVDDISPARPLGEPLWMALVDDRLVVARSEEAMDAVLAADEGDVSTMADDPLLAALARELDDAGAYSAILHRGTVPFDPVSLVLSDSTESCQDIALPETFLAVAVGVADDDGPVVVLAYEHANEAAAEANAAGVEKLITEGRSLRSEEPWRERFEVDRVDTDGTVVVARLRPSEPGDAAIWREILAQREGLVSSCPGA